VKLVCADGSGYAEEPRLLRVLSPLLSHRCSSHDSDNLFDYRRSDIGVTLDPERSDCGRNRVCANLDAALISVRFSRPLANCTMEKEYDWHCASRIGVVGPEDGHAAARALKYNSIGKGC
jgi:hypothetical protein